MAFSSFLVIEEKKKIVNHSVDNLAFFHHRSITPIETAIIRFYSPNIFWNRGAFAFIARHCVVSIQPVFLAACPHRVIERLSENALHSSPNKPQSDAIPKVTSASRSPFSGGKKEKKTRIQTHNAVMGALKPNTNR